MATLHIRAPLQPWGEECNFRFCEGFSVSPLLTTGCGRSAIFCTPKKGGAIPQKVLPFATSPSFLFRLYLDPCEGIIVAHNTVCAFWLAAVPPGGPGRGAIPVM